MKTNLDNSIGAMLNNAQTLLTHLHSFEGYKPGIEVLTPAYLQTLIEGLMQQNETVVSLEDEYTATLESRAQCIKKDGESLVQLLSPIGAAVRYSLGKTSKAAKGISASIAKIRGARFRQESKTPANKQVSQHHYSYASVLQNFSDLVTILGKNKDTYLTSNKDIQLDNLRTKLKQARSTHINVSKIYGKLKESRDDRLEMEKTLVDISQRIKDAVKSQFTLHSTEYSLVKGLNI
jgi:hypothetical protein